jgi:HEAT repeat protein
MTLDRRAVAAAGHTGDAATARRGLDDPDPAVRATALGALERLALLADATLAAALVDPDRGVRRRAVELAARHPAIDLTAALADADPAVVEAAAWACGEHERVPADTLAALIGLAGGDGAGREPLVRESAVAALGAIGDGHGLAAILAATTDRPAIRRRAVLALAPFLFTGDGGRRADVAAAVERALTDRDWQVRQAAEDLIEPPPP